MRVGILSIQHESNTFISTPTTLDHFRRGDLRTGDAIVTRFGQSHHEIGGFFKALTRAQVEAVPIFAAWSLPSGTITVEAYDALRTMMFDELEKSGPLDGLLVAPHGAAVSEEHRDMDGHWLTQLRQRVGAQVPMVCTLDPHANLSPRMIDACDATFAYRTNPHTDQVECGVEAANLMVKTVRGEILPTQAVSWPAIAINIERQETAKSPCQEMYEFAEQSGKKPAVLSNSIFLGFPYADVGEMGSAFVAITDNDPELAQSQADQLSAYLVQHRGEFVAHLIGIDEAIDQAVAVEGPVCLLDMGDNIGGGSPADGTLIAQAVHRRGGPRAFVALCDPESVERAAAAGIDAVVSLRVGGKTDGRHGPPLDSKFTVRSLHDGYFKEPRARHGGRVEYDMGRTAIVETAAGLTVQLTSQRIAPFSLHQISCCNLDPASFKILVAKGVVAPVAAYAEVCPTLIRVNTPGVTTADMNSLHYEHRKRPLFPFER